MPYILKHHGVVNVGNSLKQALCACMYLEEVANTYSIANSIDESVPELNEEQVERAVEIFKHYGQGPWCCQKNKKYRFLRKRH